MLITQLKAALAVASVLAFSSWPAFAEERLTIVADKWPPFSGAGLPKKGISIDVISEVLVRAGYDVDTQILPWARIMDGSRSGQFDIVGSLFYDPAIAEFMTYSDPFFRTSVKFVQKAGESHDVTSLVALEPHSIAVGDGFLYEQNFDRADTLNKVVVTTTLQGVQMVAFDRVDLTLDSEEVLLYALTREAPEIADRVEILPHILAEHDVYMAVRNSLENKAQLLADFNRVLSEMKQDGSLEALLAKHR